MAVTGEQWLEQLAAALGIEPPRPVEIEGLLALAGVAAHASERTAAPLSTWLAGRSGRSVAEVRLLTEQLAAKLAAPTDARVGGSDDGSPGPPA